MAMFALSALIGTPLGPLVFSWTGNKASWRWIDWTMVSWNPHLEKEKKTLPSSISDFTPFRILHSSLALYHRLSLCYSYLEKKRYPA